MKIMIFTEGTILMHSGAIGKTHKEIIRQIRLSNVFPSIFKNKCLSSVKDYESYVPIGNSVLKVKNWVNQGVEIVYMTSRKSCDEISKIKNVLDKNDFPVGKLEYRVGNEKYKDVAERVLPDVLIEDDCESIGGAREMTITFVNPKIKNRIRSIVLKEFQGIDHLSDDINNLC